MKLRLWLLAGAVATTAALSGACASGHPAAAAPPPPPAPVRAAAPAPTPAAPHPSAADTVQPGRFDTGKMWTFEHPPLDYFQKEYGFTPSAAWLEHFSHDRLAPRELALHGVDRDPADPRQLAERQAVDVV